MPPEVVIHFVKKISHNVAIGKMQNGREFRKQIAKQRTVWQLSDSIKPKNIIEMIEKFFLITEGKHHSFLMKDPSNYNVELSLCKKITNTKVQLQKIIEVQGLVHEKKIIKPITESVKIFKNGALMLNGYTVDKQTGIVTFTESIAEDEISASFDFLHHVRFDEDEISFNLQSLKLTPLKLLKLLTNIWKILYYLNAEIYFSRTWKKSTHSVRRCIYPTPLKLKQEVSFQT